MVDPVNQSPPSHSPDKPPESLKQIQRIRDQQTSGPQQGGEAQQKAISEKKDFSDIRKARSGLGEPEEQVARKSREQLEEIRQAVNDALKDMNVGLDFEEAEETEELIVKVMDRDNDELIRQIPPEAMLQVAKRMEEMSGLLIEEWG